MSDIFLVFTLTVLGFILLVIEIFIIPGFGFAGICAFLCLIWAVYVSYARLSAAAGGVVTIVSIAAVIMLVRILPETRLWKKLRLDKSEDKDTGFSAAKEGLDALTGACGTSITPLRPAGTAVINGRRVDVVAQTAMIGRDRKIKVIKVEGNKVIVKEIRLQQDERRLTPIKK